MFMIKMKCSRERDRDRCERSTGGQSFGKVALSLQETSPPTANNATQDGK